MNVSEGRDQAKVQAIVSEIESVRQARLLSSTSDPDHNRSVVSFIGSPAAIAESAFSALRKAVELIDLRIHRGVHPRLGAVDVVPFIPILRVPMQQCVEIARQLGARVASELEVPVYLYEYAALRQDRRDLPSIRKKGFEQFAQLLGSDLSLQPDFGPPRLHPSAGATIIGARRPLIAYNVYLDSSDMVVARQIACAIREADGGLPRVRALAFYITRKNQAQVSMNLIDYKQTSLLEAFQRVRQEAQHRGVDISGGEIIGLVPRAALPSDPRVELMLETFQPSQILENRIEAAIREHRSG